MLFRDHEPQALVELLARRDIAIRLHARFDAGAGTAELLKYAQLLGAAWRSLERALPTEVGSSDLKRHLRFLEYYLERGRPEACRGDIDDVCRADPANWKRRSAPGARGRSSTTRSSPTSWVG